MYKGLNVVIRRAVADPQVIEAGSAMIYQEGDGFSYSPRFPDEEYVERGSEFIKLIIANDESFSWLPQSQEARDNLISLSSLINSEAIEGK